MGAVLDIVLGRWENTKGDCTNIVPQSQQEKINSSKSLGKQSLGITHLSYSHSTRNQRIRQFFGKPLAKPSYMRTRRTSHLLALDSGQRIDS
jgi:hypothetical protein